MGTLGFNSAARGHVGWATANYCIMFRDDYLELLGIVDPTGFTNGLDERLAAGEGLMEPRPRHERRGVHRRGLAGRGPRLGADRRARGACSRRCRADRSPLRERDAGCSGASAASSPATISRGPMWRPA
ncbi:MAG: VOC family protein [Geminicoccaceae bacterium]